MAQLPYYALNQGNLQLQQTQDVVDEYAPLREGLNQAQKYFEQKEAVETSKIMSKARSDWSIRMNEMQQQAGLDYEGFSEKVNQGLQDYENEIINSVPYSQRDKFSADFAGLKYDMLNKAGAYEVTASAKWIKLNVEKTLNNWGNVILSDPSQYEAGREAISEMIDGLQAADSVKDALRKEAFNGLAVSQVNALTNINPNYLLNQLKGGAFDSVLDPKQKAASINQAIAKIKSNKLETEKRANEILNETFRNDLLKIRGGIEITDFRKMEANPIYAKDPEKIIKLRNAYFDFIEKKENNLQTTLDIEKGILMNPAAADQKRIDYAVEPLLNEIQTFDNKAKAVDKIMRQTNYVPRYWSGTLFNMSNNSNPDVRKVAYSQWYDIKTRYPSALTSIEKSKSDELFIKGAALHAGMEMSEIEKNWNSRFDENEWKRRDKELGEVIDGGINFDIDSDDAFIKSRALQLFSSAYRMMPDTKAAKTFTETVINANYGNTMVGSGNVAVNIGPTQFDYFAAAAGVPGVNYKVLTSPSNKKSFMFQPPEKVYGVIGESDEWNAKWMNDDLRMAVAEEFPDVKFKDVILDQNVWWGSDGRPVYYVMTKDGINLFPWRPDYNEYIRTKKEKEVADKEESDKIGAEKKANFARDALKGVL